MSQEPKRPKVLRPVGPDMAQALKMLVLAPGFYLEMKLELPQLMEALDNCRHFIEEEIEKGEGGLVPIDARDPEEEGTLLEVGVTVLVDGIRNAAPALEQAAGAVRTGAGRMIPRAWGSTDHAKQTRFSIRKVVG